MLDDIDRVLISEADIAARNKTLAARISADYAGKTLTIVVISNGALIFGADLVRQIPIPLQLDTISASSYSGVKSTNELTIHSGLKLEIQNRHVVVVDDIFDTGLTLARIVESLQEHEPLDIRTCVLLDKKRPRGADALIPDYVGFPIEDLFVVGYGLDYDEHYRNLPFVGVLHSDHYA
ncbi:MAG: hypoxanthine phosphoribosyltransferase [Rhodothermales bacterium]|jgi:hypoxanthine phosphoribosyltransferase